MSFVFASPTSMECGSSAAKISSISLSGRLVTTMWRFAGLRFLSEMSLFAQFRVPYGTAPLRETRRRCRLDVYHALQCDQPLTNILCWVTWTNYYQSIEQCNSEVPSLSSFIASDSILCPSLECLYQDGVYYESCPLERCNLFGIYQYVILNRRFGFWQFALWRNER